jgi:hypothetical protein
MRVEHFKSSIFKKSYIILTIILPNKGLIDDDLEECVLID